MKASLFMLSAGASMTLASPLDKRVLEIVTATEVVYYTVTEAEIVSVTPTVSRFKKPNGKYIKTTVTAVPTTTSEAPQTTVIVQPSETQTSASTAVNVDKTSAAPAAASPSDFASTAVYHHNLHRANNSAPAVTWGETYANYAKQVSASCKFAHDLTPGGGNYGQNIAMWASTGDAESLGAENAIAQAITNMWYNGEIGLYPSSGYGKANPDLSAFESWGHYSQVVWVGSTVIGCDARYCPAGTMESDMGAWFSVCNYYPAGNMGGEYGKNVLQPLGQATVNA